MFNSHVCCSFFHPIMVIVPLNMPCRILHHAIGCLKLTCFMCYRCSWCTSASLINRSCRHPDCWGCVDTASQIIPPGAKDADALPGLLTTDIEL